MINDIVVSMELLESVFFIKVKEGTGSSFTFTHKNKQFLVSAQHVFEDYKHNDNIEFEIFHENQWKKINGQLWKHDQIQIDVCVIQLEVPIAPLYEFETKNSTMMLGQEYFMLGFPYGLFQDSNTLNRNYPFALAKKASISAFINQNNQGTIYLLDGHNNKGFSGGPVCYHHLHNKRTVIIGIISGYIPQEGTIPSPFGDLKYNENSGIVITYPISNAIDIIEKNMK